MRPSCVAALAAASPLAAQLRGVRLRAGPARLSCLSGLPNLEELELDGSAIDVPPRAGVHQHLRKLSVHGGCSVPGLSAVLGSCPSLTTLCTSAGNLSELGVALASPYLRRLEVDQVTPYTRLHLAGLPALQETVVEGVWLQGFDDPADVPGLMRHLASWPSLRLRDFFSVWAVMASAQLLRSCLQAAAPHTAACGQMGRSVRTLCVEPVDAECIPLLATCFPCVDVLWLALLGEGVLGAAVRCMPFVAVIKCARTPAAALGDDFVAACVEAQRAQRPLMLQLGAAGSAAALQRFAVVDEAVARVCRDEGLPRTVRFALLD